MSSLPEDLDPKDMPPGTKIWYYVRHSPGDNQTIDSQVAAIMRLVKEKGWLITREFKDESLSGVSTRNRKAFELMIHLARQKPRQADMLIVWEFSRFARDQVDSQFYRAELRRNGWKLLSMKDDIPKGPISPIFEALIDWKNEQFIIDLRANTKRGLRYIAEQGCVPTGPVAKGYTYQGKQIGVTREGVLRMGRKPEPDLEVAPLVVTAFEMKAVGAPYEVIAQKTSLYPAKSGSWHSFFHNRVYIGEYEFDGEVFRTIYPPLISTVLFEAVQKHLPQKQRKFTRQHHPRRKGSTYFLVDVAVCGYCGQPMEGKSANSYRYYVCSQRNHHTDLCPQAQLIRADDLEAEVIRILRQHILSAEYLTGLLAWTNEVLSEGTAELQLRVEATQRELAEANQMALKMARNFALMERLTRSAELLLREQDERVIHLQTTLIALEYELAHSHIETTPEEIKDYVNRTQTLLQRAEFFDLREVCGQLCARIIMKPDECRLELNFPAI